MTSPAPPSEERIPSLPQLLTMARVVVENQAVAEFKKFIRLVENSKGTPEERSAIVRKSVEETVLQLHKPNAVIISKEADLEKEKAKVEKKSRDVSGSDASFHDKLANVLKIQVDEERIETLRQHYERYKLLVQSFMSFVNFMQREWPCVVVKVNRDLLMDSISKVPSQSVYKLRKKAISLKVKEMKDKHASERPETVVAGLIEDASKRFTEFDDFFEDEGAVARFEVLVGLFPSVAKRRLKEKMKQCYNSPGNCGELLIDECNNIISLLKIVDERAMKILFLTLARYLFNDMYVRFIAAKLTAIDYTFALKVSKILEFPPVQFPHSTKFLAPEYHLIPMREFPEEHFYTGCIRMVEQLLFEVCPIDFCVAAHRCLREIENVAVFVRDDPSYALSIDEIFDISMIVVVLACPLELPRMINVFAGYIEGLRLPSRLKFAFTTFKAICDNITAINLDDVCM